MSEGPSSMAAYSLEAVVQSSGLVDRGEPKHTAHELAVFRVRSIHTRSRAAQSRRLPIAQQKSVESPFKTLDLSVANDAKGGLWSFAANAKSLRQFPQTGHSPRNRENQATNDWVAGLSGPSLREHNPSQIFQNFGARGTATFERPL